MLINYGIIIMRGKLVDGREIRRSAGAKYITSVRRNRICMQVRPLVLDKSKDS